MSGRSSSSKSNASQSSGNRRPLASSGGSSSTPSASRSTGSQTVTIDELLEREPTLRIRLRERAQQYIERGEQVNFRQLLEFIFKKSSESTSQTVDNPNSNRTTEENVAALRRIFQQFKDTVNRYEDEVLRSLDQLPDEQQEQVVVQFEQATEFIGDLFGWLDKVFDYAVEKVRAGYTIERDAVRKLFGSVRDELNKLFEH